MVSVQVLCTNPLCGASYSLSSADVRGDDRCRNCGHRLDRSHASGSRADSASAPEGGPESFPSPPPGLIEGSTFGRYRIVRTLGQGGMGSVYLAHDTQLDRRVALKVPHLGERDGSETLERFYREAKAAAALDHPNLCPVYDVGQINGSPYLTMAYVEGRPLSQLIGRKDGWPPRQVAAVVRKLAQALQEAHDRGVVHRDLKPANVLVSRRSELVVVDFGLARRDGAGDARLTRSGVILGTPAYMAPEQVAGDVEAVGPCSDVYALGVILYELLTGRLPFDGPVALVLAQVMVAEPEPPSRTRPDVDPRLEAACLKALAKKPLERFGSMGEFADAMTEYLRGGALPSAVSSSQAEMPALDLTSPEPRPSGGESLVGRFFEGLLSRRSVSPVPGVSVSKGLEPEASVEGPPVRPRSRRLVAAGAGAGTLLLLLGVIIYVATDEGTVRIELSDPKSNVEVRVDGKSIAVAGLDEPLRLRVGDHKLEVEGKGFEARGESFTIKRGENPTIRFQLLESEKAVGNPVAAPTVGPEPDPGFRKIEIEEVATSHATVAGLSPGPTTQSPDDPPPSYKDRIADAQKAIRDRDWATVDRRLEACSSEDRGWEWGYLKRLARPPVEIATPGTASGSDAKRPPPGLTLNHPTMVSAVSFNPAGTRIASAFPLARAIQIADAMTGKTLLDIPTGHQNEVWSVAYSPNGKQIVTGSHDDNGNVEGVYKVWDASDGKPIRTIRGSVDVLYGARYSADGQWLVGRATDDRFVVFEAATGQERRILGKEGHGIFGGWDLSPTNRRITFASKEEPGIIESLDLEDGKEVDRFQAPEGNQVLCYFPDGHRLVTATTNGSSVWDATTGQEVVKLERTTGNFNRGMVTSDGRWLVGGTRDGHLHIWDASTGRHALAFQAHSEPIWSLAGTRDGRRIASGSFDKTTKIWELSAAPEGALKLRGHSDAVTSLAFGPGGRHLATASRDQTIKLWNPETGRLLQTFSDPSDRDRGMEGLRVMRIAFSPNGKFVATTDAGCLRVWDAATGKKAELPLYGSFGFTAWDVAFSPSGHRLFAAGNDCSIFQWDATTWKGLESYRGEPKQAVLASVRSSPDGKRVFAASSDQLVKVWDADSRKELSPLEGHSAAVSAIDLSPDGRQLASACVDGTVRIFDIPSQRVRWARPAHAGGAGTVAFSPDGKRLASSGSDGMVRIRAASDGLELIALAHPAGGAVDVLAFSPDGARLAVGGSGGEVQVWCADWPVMGSTSSSPDKTENARGPSGRTSGNGRTLPAPSDAGERP